MIESPICLSPETYAAMRAAGYIDADGNLTPAANDLVALLLVREVQNAAEKI
jgi:hypothetical protein